MSNQSKDKHSLSKREDAQRITSLGLCKTCNKPITHTFLKVVPDYCVACSSITKTIADLIEEYNKKYGK